MGDRFYSQQLGKNGYSKTKAYAGMNSIDKPKRRLKADIVKHVCALLKEDNLPSMSKMTIADLEKIEKKLAIFKFLIK